MSGLSTFGVSFLMHPLKTLIRGVLRLPIPDAEPLVEPSAADIEPAMERSTPGRLDQVGENARMPRATLA